MFPSGKLTYDLERKDLGVDPGDWPAPHIPVQDTDAEAKTCRCGAGFDAEETHGVDVTAELTDDEIKGLFDAAESGDQATVTALLDAIDSRLETKAAGQETPGSAAATNRLRNYWAHGPGAAKIAWGTAGDWKRCVGFLSKYMTPEQAKGFCNLAHKRALGYYPATHAAMDRGGKGKAKKADPQTPPAAELTPASWRDVLADPEAKTTTTAPSAKRGDTMPTAAAGSLEEFSAIVGGLLPDGSTVIATYPDRVYYRDTAGDLMTVAVTVEGDGDAAELVFDGDPATPGDDDDIAAGLAAAEPDDDGDDGGDAGDGDPEGEPEAKGLYGLSLPGTLESIRDAVAEAARARFRQTDPVSGNPTSWVSITGTYTDSVVVCVEDNATGDSRYFLVPYSSADGTITLGDPKPVTIEPTLTVPDDQQEPPAAEPASGAPGPAPALKLDTTGLSDAARRALVAKMLTGDALA
jgi:hypothetical protein